MPQLQVKIKEETMDQKKCLNDLEEALDQLFCGLNALFLMSAGLDEVQDDYADGFHALCRALRESEAEVQALFAAVSAAAVCA